jgi:hypothetical protein
MSATVEQLPELTIEFRLADFLPDFERNFAKALAANVVKATDKPAWLAGLRHCGEQVKQATSFPQKIAALAKAEAEAQSLLKYLTGWAAEAFETDLNFAAMRGLVNVPELAPAEKAQILQSFQQAHKEHEKSTILAEAQQLIAKSTDLAQKEFLPLLAHPELVGSSMQSKRESLAARFYAARFERKSEIIKEAQKLIGQLTEQKAKLAERATERVAQPAEAEPTTGEMPTQTERELETRVQEVDTSEATATNDKLQSTDPLRTTTPAEWQQTLASIEASVSYRVVSRQYSQLLAAQESAPQAAQSLQSQMAAARQSQLESGESEVEPVSALSRMRKFFTQTDTPAAAEPPSEAELVGDVIGRLSLRQRLELVAPFVNLGFAITQDQEAAILRTLLTAKTPELRLASVQAILAGRAS